MDPNGKQSNEAVVIVPARLVKQLGKLGLSPVDWTVASVLLAHANAEGECWPSIRTLASCMNVSDSTIQRSLHRLRESGWLDLVGWKEIKHGYVPVYSVNALRRGEPVSPVIPVAPVIRVGTGSTSETGVTSDEQPVAPVTPKVDPMEVDPGTESCAGSTGITDDTGSGAESEEGKDPEGKAASVPEPPEWCFALAGEMVEAMAARSPSFTRPSEVRLRRWADELHKLQRIDKRTPDEVRRTVRFAMGHEFWSGVIQSGAAMRKHWNSIVLQQERGNGNGYRPGWNRAVGAAGREDAPVAGPRQREIDAQAERRRARWATGVAVAPTGAAGGDSTGGESATGAGEGRSGAVPEGGSETRTRAGEAAACGEPA